MEKQMFKCKSCNYFALKRDKLFAHLKSHLGDGITEEFFDNNMSEFFEPYIPQQSGTSNILDFKIQKCGFGRSLDLYQGQIERINKPLFDSIPEFDNWNHLVTLMKEFEIKDLKYQYYTLDENKDLIYKPYSDHKFYSFLLDFYSFYLIRFGADELRKYGYVAKGISKSAIENLIYQCKILIADFFEDFNEFLDENDEGPIPNMIVVNGNVLIRFFLLLNKKCSHYELGYYLGLILSYYVREDLQDIKEECEDATKYVSNVINYLLKSSVKTLFNNPEFFQGMIDSINKVVHNDGFRYLFTLNDFLINSDVFCLDWKYIDFYYGKIHLYHPKEYNSRTCYPFILENPESRKSFNEIKKYLRNKNNGPLVKTKDNRIIQIINPEFITESIYLLNQRLEKISWNEHKDKKLFGHNLSQEEIIAKIKSSNSESLNFLCSNQHPDFKLIYCPENRTYQNSNVLEDAFIFTLRIKGNSIFVVYENALENNASYCFEVDKDKINKVINVINKYFSSLTLNKREHVADFAKLVTPYVHKFKRVSHNGYEWMQKMLGNIPF